jgi:hypothetical protein
MTDIERKAAFPVGTAVQWNMVSGALKTGVVTRVRQGRTTIETHDGFLYSIPTDMIRPLTTKA